MRITATTGQRKPDSYGFTLIEILMAIGIFAMGMTMAAALLPAAIKEGADSFKNQIGMNIAESGLATAQAGVLSYSFKDDGNDMVILADENHTSDTGNTFMFGLRQTNVTFYYGPERDMGFALLGRKTEAGDYLIVSVAWKRFSQYANNPGKIVLRQINCDVGVNSDSVSNASDLRVGSPLIVAEPLSQAGLFATIKEVDGNKARLAYPLGNSAPITKAYILVEEGQDRLSPALATMSVRTGLSYRQ